VLPKKKLIDKIRNASNADFVKSFNKSQKRKVSSMAMPEKIRTIIIASFISDVIKYSVSPCKTKNTGNRKRKKGKVDFNFIREAALLIRNVANL